MSVAVALPAALAYGVADFAGGLATRRAAVLAVTAGAQFLGLIALVPAVFLVPGAPSAAALGIGALAGIAGASGLLLYFRGLAVGPMGVVAPLSAVVGAGLPLLVGLAGGERLGAVAVAGLVVALAAIVLATAGTRDAVAVRGILLGLASGAGFGLFFVGLDATPEGSGLWPLLAGRVVSVALLGLLIAALCVRRGREAALGRATRGVVVLVAVSGVFDSLANVLFLLATRLGDLGVSAVLVSLYPVVVVLLARLVLHERLSTAQLTSAGLALTASALLALG
ncbi:EamA family transporter [Pseudonocardia broussonetiae]|uniref:EamA family transporter n=1 Tax=Pseudonocardia broussonetiae TaxID=2736640 RepID=A0A6M6JDK5_9PSEU|nr:EamA family transporter [Pseudonocardia broussonetiae]QJY45085.1 EamA family transporter [Pseudonocardia broussonetiae]